MANEIGARWRGQYARSECSACHASFSPGESLLIVYMPPTERLALLCAKCYQTDSIEAALGHPSAP